MFDTAFDDRFYTKLGCLGGEGLRGLAWEAYIEARKEYLAERAESAPAPLGATRDPIVLSIRESTSHEREFEAPDYERFVFELDGAPYLWGTLNECMEARHAYALECDQRGVPYTVTDLPEPYESDLADFYANPIVGGKP
jgi:hypothetical protein